MAVKQKQMKKHFLGILLVFSVIFANAQDKIVSIDCISAESYLNYLPNDLVVFNPMETKQDSAVDALIRHINLVENEYIPDVKIASYLKADTEAALEEVYSAVWKVYFTNVENGCKLDMELFRVQNADKDTLNIENYTSSSALEEEVFQYLSVSDDYDYYHETWGAIEPLEDDSAAMEAIILKNPIANLLNEECYIPMDIDMGAVYALLGEENLDLICDDCEFTDGIGWGFGESTSFFVYSFPKNERIYVLTNSAPNEIIDLALFDFSIGSTTKMEILEQYDLDPEVVQTIDSMEDTSFDVLYRSGREYIPVKQHDLFVKLEFQDEILRGILYSDKEF